MPEALDQVFIEGLEIEAIIGVYDWEKTTRQIVLIDLVLGQDNRRAASRDQLEDAVNYDTLARRITEFVAGHPFDLIETVAERCAEIVLREFDVPQLSITVRKPGAVDNAAAVGVRITRHRNSHT